MAHRGRSLLGFSQILERLSITLWAEPWALTIADLGSFLGRFDHGQPQLGDVGGGAVDG